MSVYCYCERGHLAARLPLIGSRDVGRVTWLHGKFGTTLTEQPDHCFECGAATMTACKHCSIDIQLSAKYCGKCGKPFPWTEDALAAAREYTDEIEDISDVDKAALKDTFRDLTIETSRTPLAATRFMRIVRRSGPVVYETLREILVDVMAETAVKITTGR
jgi:hypothetical protein